jgi:hypothetical protein
MPVKIARSTPRLAFGLPEVLVAVSTSRLSCCKAGKARIFTPVRESSGESRSKENGAGFDQLKRRQLASPSCVLLRRGCLECDAGS